MPLQEAIAHQAMAQLADAMGVESVELAAWAVLQVANATMERAIRRISVERGYDPRLFTLVAFGGAGGLHACELAESLQIPQVFVPALPGVLSALGMLVAAPTKDYSQTVMLRAGTLSNLFAPLRARALIEMSAEGYTADALLWEQTVDMRYVGQSHELVVPCPMQVEDVAEVVPAFHQAHQQRYGYHQPQAAVETVTIRLKVTAPITPPSWQLPDRHPLATATPIGWKEVWFAPDRPTLTALYDRGQLTAGTQLFGPALLFQYDTTTLIPPNWAGNIDSHGHLLLQHTP